MKLTAKQYQDLLEVFARHHRQPDAFELVKRKGRIIITDKQSGQAFSYFLKKTTRINPDTQQFENYSCYLVRISGKDESTLQSWDETMACLSRWLTDL